MAKTTQTGLLQKLLGRFIKRPAKHLRTGIWGENVTVREMQRIGLEILRKNYRVHGIGEIDIIARDGNCLVFVEVKTRAFGQTGRPALAINREKRRKLWRTAQYFMKRLGKCQPRFRFDVAEVIYKSRFSYEVLYLPNTFSRHIEQK